VTGTQPSKRDARGQPSSRACCSSAGGLADPALLANPAWRQGQPATTRLFQRCHQMLAQQAIEISILKCLLGDRERVSNISLGFEHEDLHPCVEFAVVAMLITPELSAKEFTDKLELQLIELPRGLWPFTHERNAVHHICRSRDVIFHAVAN